jgi:membrane protease YdiL (CAAX protease family)
MNKFRYLMKNKVRPIALAVFFSASGLSLRLLLRLLLDVEVSILLASVINFVLAALAAFFIFPRCLKEPFGEVGLPEYMRRLGFYLPLNAWKHAVLGMVLALCTLVGMLVGSILTGRYELDWSTINISHTVFSLNPGVWEEVFFRGVIMAVLLTGVKSVRQAALIQILLFGLIHIKGADPWSWVDVISVMVIALAFTYVAYKTRTLLAGIVFHFLHDALLFFVQVPEGEYFGFTENMLFYVALWIMVGMACLLTKVVTEKLGVQAQVELYRVDQNLSEGQTKRYR